MANIIKIDKEDYNNGPGVRVVVWFAGCDHRCPSCHNPDTWDYEQGFHLTKYWIDEIIDLVDKDYIQGLTLSGGDPLSNKNYLAAVQIADAFHERFGDNPKKDLWVWTGFKLNQLHPSVLDHPAINVIVDGKFIERKKNLTLKYRGSSNQTIWSKDGIKFKDITNILDKE